MNLSLPFKSRLMELAGLDHSGLFSEGGPYARSNERIPFSQELMQQAIEYGLEVGLLFQSKNKKYKMPISKYRLILPVAMGIDHEGRLMVRGVHIMGQSEKEAILTKKRSAEAKNVWRLFGVSNIKSMFFTGKTYTKVPIGGYNANDSAFSRIMASFDPAQAKKSQDAFNQKQNATVPEKIQERQKLVRSFFRRDARSEN
jgi:hypothetical protein